MKVLGGLLVVAALFFVTIYFGIVHPWWKDDQGQSVAWTRNCVSKSDSLDEDKQTSKAFSLSGAQAIGIRNGSTNAIVIIAASRGQAQSAADVLGGQLKKGGLSQEEVDARTSRSGPVVLLWGKGFNRARTADMDQIADCVYSIRSNRLAGLIGIDTYQVGRPFREADSKTQTQAASGSQTETQTTPAFLSEIVALRQAMTSGDANAAIPDLYDLLDKQGKVKDANKSAATLKHEVPVIADRYEASYPATRRAVTAVTTDTAAARDFKAFDLWVLDSWHKELPKLKSDVQRSSNTWGAAVRFGNWNNRFLSDTNKRLDRYLSSLPPSQRKALEEAVRAAGSGG